jgi:beta-lactamase regulating signal transducer with metallopeptidase domain
MTSEILTGLPERIGWTLLHSVWQFTAIAVGLLFVLPLLRRSSSALRYVTECLALTSMITLVVVTFCCIDMPTDASHLARTPIAAQSDEAVDGESATYYDAVSEVNALPIGSPWVSSPERNLGAESVDLQLPPAGRSTASGNGGESIRLQRWRRALAEAAEPCLGELCLIWLIGMLLLSVRPILAFGYAGRLRHHGTTEVNPDVIDLCERLSKRIGVHRFVHVVQSFLVDVPTLIGWLRPMILLPASALAGLTPEQLQGVIAHELAHVRRHDYLVNALQVMLETIFFYHPAVWWVSRRMRVSREECCDDLAVSLTGDRTGYAQLLVRLDENRRGDLGASYALSASGGSLIERIRRIVQPEASTNAGAGLVLLAMLAVLMISSGGFVLSAMGGRQANDRELSGESTVVAAGDVTVPHASSNDGPMGMSSASDSQPAEISRTTQQPSIQVPETGNVHSIRFVRDGAGLTSIAYGDGNAREGRYPRVRSWDIRTRQLTKEVPLAWQTPWRRFTGDLLLSEDSNFVFGSLGDRLGVWDASTGKLLHRLDPQWNGFGELTLGNIAATRSADIVACTGLTNRLGLMHDGLLFVWNVSSGELLQAITSKHTGDIRSMALSDDGKRIAAWPGNGGVGIWEVASGKQIFKFANRNSPDSAPFPENIPGALDQVLGMQFSHDGKTLAIGDLVGVKLLDTGSGEVLQRLRAPFRYDYPSFVFSPNDQMLLRYGVHLDQIRNALLWDTQSGRQIATLEIDGAAAAFSNDSDLLAIGRSASEQAISIWQVASDPYLDKEELKVDGERGSSAWYDDDRQIHWGERAIDQWTTGVRLMQFPSGDDPRLIVEFLLRNKAGTKRVADLSFDSGPMQFELDAKRTIEPWAAAQGNRSLIEKFEVDPNDVLTDPRFRQQLDFTGLDAGMYQLRLRSFFSLPTGQPGTRHGIPLRFELPVMWNGQQPAPTSPTSPQETLAKSVEKPTIHWGDSVAGLRMGVAWSDTGGSERCRLVYGSLAEADLYVQNLTHKEINCELALPHTMDGWGFSILDSAGKHMQRKQTIFTGFEPQRILFAELRPGQIARVTGSSSDFRMRADPPPTEVTVARLLFKVAAELPGESQAYPPYTYGLPAGAYSLRAYMLLRRSDVPGATLILETATAPFDTTSAQPKFPSDEDKDAEEDPRQVAAATDTRKRPWRAFGRVVDKDGQPLAGVTIRAATGWGTLLGGGKTTTDTNGRYDFRFGMGIMFGDITDAKPHPQTQVAQVTAHLNGHFEKNFSRHGNGMGSLQPVSNDRLKGWNLTEEQVVLPDKPREVDFVMLPAAKVCGTLVDENDQPLAEYSVSLTGDELPPGSSVLSQVRTDRKGRFVISEIPTTVPYQFEVRKPKDQLKPPWNDSWASGPITFRDPGDADLATAIKTARVSIDEFIAKQLRLKIIGPGVHGKIAVQTARDYQPLPVDSSLGLKADRVELEKLTLEMKNEVATSRD